MKHLKKSYNGSQIQFLPFSAIKKSQFQFILQSKKRGQIGGYCNKIWFYLFKKNSMIERT